MPAILRNCTRTVPLFALLAVLACKESNDPNFGPLSEPEAGSMAADFAFFTTAPGQVQGTPGAHFQAAAALAELARVSTIAVSDLPRAILAGAATASPDNESDGTHWTYNVVRNDVLYQADLVGQRESNGDSEWEMRVSSSTSTPLLDEFLWFRGDMNRFQTDGSWHVFDASAPGSNTEILEIDWSHSGSWRVVFHMVRTGQPNLGDWFEYEEAGSLRRLRHFDESTDVTTIVQWNVQTREGYISASTYNGGQRGCWSASLQNTACVI